MPRIRSYKWADLAEETFAAYRADTPEAIAVDTETTGYTYFDTAFCATVAWEGHSGYFELADAIAHEAFKEILANAKTWIFHNAKFDLHKLLDANSIVRSELDAHDIHDTEALAHLLDEHQAKGLKELARKYLGETTNEETQVRKARQKLKLRKSDGYDKLPRQVIYPYALKDAEFTWNLWTLLRPQVERHKDLLELYEREQQLMLVLLDVEAAGMGLDLPLLQRSIKDQGDKAIQLESIIASLVGKPVGKDVKKGEFNPASPQQLLEVFAERGHVLPGTSKEILSQVPDDLARALLDYRSVQKMRNTYLLPMLEEQRDGILHPNFRQHRTKTGRMASGAANDA